jgi:hypothetical protein
LRAAHHLVAGAAKGLSAALQLVRIEAGLLEGAGRPVLCGLGVLKLFEGFFRDVALATGYVVSLGLRRFLGVTRLGHCPAPLSGGRINRPLT